MVVNEEIDEVAMVVNEEVDEVATVVTGRVQGQSICILVVESPLRIFPEQSL